MRRKLAQAVVVVALVSSMIGSGLPARAASNGAVLSGTILQGDHRLPAVGAKLLVSNAQGGKIFASTPTGADGRFAVRDLPAATYELVVQARGGLYPTSAPIQLASGQAQEVQLALADSTPPPTGSGNGLPGPKPSAWSNPLTATLAVLGVAVVVGLALQNATEDNQASPTGP